MWSDLIFTLFSLLTIIDFLFLFKDITRPQHSFCGLIDRLEEIIYRRRW